MTINRVNTVRIPDSHSKCVMCGEDNEQSHKLTFCKDESGGVSADFTSYEDLQGYAGLMHGGMISSLLDCAMTHCLFARNIEGVTAELSVRYVKPVPCCSVMRITAIVERSILSLHFLKAELAINNEVYATAEGKFMELKAHAKR